MPDWTKKVIKLFDSLLEQGEEIKKTCKRLYFSGNKKTIQPEFFESWKTNCLTLLKSTFGSSSAHYDSFVNLKFFDYYNSMQIYLGILKGAKVDLEEGYFFHKDLMLSVNIFDSLLSRAREYCERGNEQKAAVILETVLLEILTKICENKKLAYRREDNIPMIAEKLATANVILDTVHTKLDEIQDHLSNSSGLNAVQFTEYLEWIQEFLNDYLGSQIMILN